MSKDDSLKRATQWTPIGPRPERSIEVPPLAKQVGDYVLAWDEDKERLVYAISPDYHQWGHAWAWDGTSWQQTSSTTVRVGDARQAWAGGYDPKRRCVVAWTFTGHGGESAPVGCALTDGVLTMIVSDAAESDYSDPKPKRVVCDGDVPRAPDAGTWDHLVGVFGIDKKRGVTVCLTQRAVYELDGTRWKKCAESDARLVPSDVDGNTTFTGAGAGSAWDPARGQLLFWLYDGDADRFVVLSWDGAALAPVDAGGLPDGVHESFGAKSFAAGADHERGLVVYVGPHAYALGAQGFARVSDADVDGAPTRMRAAHLASTPSSIVIGPGKTEVEQRTFSLLERGAKSWSKQGASVSKSALASLSSGYVGFATSGGALVAAGVYLRTARFDERAGWQEIVSDKAGDGARAGKRVQALVTAWGGLAHAIFDDGSVMKLDGDAWRAVTAKSPDLELSFPLAAFDESRGAIVVWGSGKKSGGRKNDTFTFDGKDWTKAKKPAKPADIDDKDAQFDLVYDATKRAVVRVGRTELATFDGAKWSAVAPKGMKAAVGTWRRVVACGADGVFVVNQLEQTIAFVDDTKAEQIATIAKPHMPAAHNSNLAWDRTCIDGTKLFAFFDEDATACFVTDLAELRRATGP